MTSLDYHLLDGITDGVLWLDAAWRCLYANEAAAGMLGVPRDALLGHVPWQVRPQVLDADFARRCRLAAETRTPVAWEVVDLARDGVLETRAHPTGGGLMVCLHDVTDRRREQQRLAAAEAHYRRLVVTTPNAVYVVDRQGRFTEVNPAAERMLGVPAAALLGHPADARVVAEDQARVREAFRQVRDGEATGFDVLMRVRRPSGEIRWLAATATAMREAGVVTGLHGIARDLTDEYAAKAALRESEARLQQIAERVHEIFWEFSPDFTRTLYISPAYEQVWGEPVADAYESPANFLALIHPDDMPAVREAIAGVASGPLAVEYRVVRRDGGVRWVLSRGYPVRGADGLVASVVGSSTDITERKLAELALREKQEELLQILEALPVGVSLVGPRGEQVWFNAALDRIWAGPRPTGAERYSSYVGYASGSTTRLADDEWPILRALRGEVVSGEVIDIRAFDGTCKATVVSAVPLRDASGAITGAIAVQEDVTDRRALETRQRLLATVFERLRDGVWVATRDGRVLYANRTCAEILGMVPEHVVDLNLADLPATSELGRQYDLIIEHALAAGRWSGRVSHQRPLDGTPVPLDIVVSHVVTAQGDDLLCGLVKDATEEIGREQQLRRAERLASIGTLVAGVAHELNNPLQAILSFTQLLRLNAQRAEDAEALAVMQREAERMAKVVADLKHVARSTQATARAGAVDLNEVVQHVCRAQVYRLRTGNIEVTQHLASGLPRVLADRAQLEQVVLNLVVNACQAMEAARRSGRLVLRTALSTRGVSLHVVDDGVGIPREDLERIFDPFFTTKAPGEGTGLGLSVVHSLVTEHGGAIQVESAPGLGTAVHVEWPAAAVDGDRESEAPRAPGGIGSARRVLVVDDEPAIRLVLTQFLQQRGHLVEAVSEGAAALRLLESSSFDVILSDLRMPGLDGGALLARLRSMGVTSRLAFMTGDPSSLGHLADDPGIALLMKPMKLEDVAAVVEAP